MPVAGGAGFLVKVELDFAVVDRHRKLGAAGVEVEAAQAAVVHEPRHVLLARVAVTRHLPRRPAEELELAFPVERVGDGGGGDGAMRVQVEIARAAAALVAGADAGLLAAVTLERRLRELELEVVLVAEVGDFAVSHGGAWTGIADFFTIIFNFKMFILMYLVREN